MDDSRFGPYRIEGLIGRGGMGVVHRAVDTRKNRTVALKRLPREFAEDARFRAGFRREAEAAGRLMDPHIVPIHDFGEIDGQFFIDMRFIRGADLATLLAHGGPIPPARAAGIVTQIAAALDEAHGAGLVHRDVKPSNILVAGGGGGDFAYLIDFGIVRATMGTTLTAAGRAAGTFPYMAPERFGGDAGDARVDVYALGCVLHESLTGRQPFPEDHPARVVHAHLYAPPPRPADVRPGVPTAFDAVVARAMAKDPGHRYARAGELAAAARLAAAPGPVPLPTAGPPSTAGPLPTAGPPSTAVPPPRPGPVPVPRHAFRGADRTAVWATGFYAALIIALTTLAGGIGTAVVAADVAGALLLAAARYALGAGEPRTAAAYTGLTGGLGVHYVAVTADSGPVRGAVPLVLVVLGLVVAAIAAGATRDPTGRARARDAGLLLAGLGTVFAPVSYAVLTLDTAPAAVEDTIFATAAAAALLTVLALVMRLRGDEGRTRGGVFAAGVVVFGADLTWQAVRVVTGSALRALVRAPVTIVLVAGTVVYLVLMIVYLVRLAAGARRSRPA